MYGSVSKELELAHKKLLDDSVRRKWEVSDWTEESDLMLIIVESLLYTKGQVKKYPKVLIGVKADWSPIVLKVCQLHVWNTYIYPYFTILIFLLLIFGKESYKFVRMNH